MRRILVPRASGVLSALGLAAAERRRDHARTVLLHGPALTRSALEVRDGEAAYDVRYRGQSFELTVRGCGPEPRGGAQGVRGRPRGALRLSRRWRGDRGGHHPRALRRAGARRRLRRRRAAGGRGSLGRAAARGDARRAAAAGAGAPTPPARSCWSARREPRPHRPAGRHGSIARGLRGDGRRARALGPLGQHQGAPRLLDGAVRSPRRDGHAGRAHPRAPRCDAGCGRGRPGPCEPGDDASWVLNDPFAGGTHLPDITVVTPVVRDGALLGFAASRAHHADVGGRTPGSMPADSTSLDEEGVVIAPRRLDEAAITELTGRMRQPAQRRADLRAQLAANRMGVLRLTELARRVGAGALRRGDRGGARLRRAAHARVPGGAGGRHAIGDRRAGGARGRPAPAPGRDRRR